MSNDYTQRQTVGEQMRAEELSLRATIPPAEVPGYRLERLLGQGAFGQVWVGKNLNTGRTIAVKFYLHRGGVDWSLLAREVKHLVSMAANRFIVQVLEVGWDAEPPYYVMEYLENGSLDDLIRARGSLSVSQASELFVDIAMGLNHSHGKGVLHCDLKPANILLDHDMRPRLADFGQSRMSHEQTPSLGTLFYMAPEQADLNAVPDAKWDVYALGAILYCMLCGSPPYRSPDMVNTLDTAANLPERLQRYRDAISQSPSPRHHHRIRGMDRDLAGIIDHCLAKNPEQRFANVQQVLESLEKRNVARNRRPLMILGIVGPLLLLIVMGFFSWRGVRRAQEDSFKQLREWSLRSNEFAAKFAARTLETEFASFFRLLADEANRNSFQSKFQSCIEVAGPKMLQELSTEGTSDEARKKFLQLSVHRELQTYLEEQLSKLMEVSQNKPAKFSSLIVLDAKGNNLATAISPDEDVGELPSGRNFAYRSYFTGFSKELPVHTDRSSLKPFHQPFVSSPFKSTSTHRWKIGISTPIFDEEDESGRSVQGLMVLTINLGDFELLASKRGVSDKGEEDSENRLAVLAASQAGGEGRILQHPALKTKKIEELHQIIDPVQFDSLKGQGTFGYIDPVSKSEPEYSGSWIAAMAKVQVFRKDVGDGLANEDGATELWVLVQEKLDIVTAPVNALGSKLLREGVIALLTILTVICALWAFVLRGIKLPELAAGSGRDSGTADTGASADATITVN